MEALVTGHPWDVKKVSSLGLVTYKKVKVPSLYGSWDKQGFVKVAVSIGSISAVSRVQSLILPEKRLFRGMSAGSFSRTAAGNRAYC